jgi:hypothetical protein
VGRQLNKQNINIYIQGVCGIVKRAAATTQVPTKRELIDKQIEIAGRCKEM